jgi:hypothetical protein
MPKFEEGWIVLCEMGGRWSEQWGAFTDGDSGCAIRFPTRKAARQLAALYKERTRIEHTSRLAESLRSQLDDVEAYRKQRRERGG